MNHRNFIHRLIATVVCILSISSAYADLIEVDGIYYYITSLTDLTCGVTKGDSKYSGKVVIPAQIQYKTKTLAVTSISMKAFYDCASLESVELPNSVTSIEDQVFDRCSSLKSIKLSNSLESIGLDAFSECGSLKSIELPNSVRSIRSGAFRGCSSLQSVKLPNSLEFIGSLTFAGCSSLQSIELPNSVTSIEKKAFAGCSSLQSIEFPNSVTSIGEEAFANCSSLEFIELPNSVTSIEAMTFSGCSKLEQINFGNNLTRLNYGTFSGCKSLKSITIPSNIKEIEMYNKVKVFGKYENHDWIFDGCQNLIINIEYSPDILKSYYRDGKDSFIDRGNRWQAVEKLYIDRNWNSEMRLRDLKELTIGEHVETLDVYSLNDLSKLESITSYAVTPPTIPSCTTKQYTDLVVKVPKGCLEAYQNASVWKNFWNISEMEDASTGIDDVIVNQPKKELGRYNMQGNRVGDDYKGIVIVKYSDGTTSKIINK